MDRINLTNTVDATQSVEAIVSGDEADIDVGNYDIVTQKLSK